MAKFYGKVGYVEPTLSDSPSVWAESDPVEYWYYGDVIKNVRRLETGSDLNDDIAVSNSISILADAYAFEHFFAIRYVCWMGTKWKVTNVEVQSPRLVLTLGGMYHGYEN